MEKFDLSLWLKNKSRKVVTRTGEPVEIVLTNWGDPFTILGRIGNSGDPIIWLSDGRSDMGAKLHDNDLFFADEEEKLQSIEIPFGAKDSEFIKDEYLIPEGCEARIEGNKIIIEKKEEELNEFEKELQTIISETSHWTSDDGSISTYCQFEDKEIKKISVQILDLARRELQPEFDKEMDKMLAETDKVVYQKGREDALKDLPKWEKEHNAQNGIDAEGTVHFNGWSINLKELFKILSKED